MTAQEAYDALQKEAREISLLYSTMSALHWDEQTYMPRKGSSLRAEQISYLSGLAHERLTSTRIGDLLSTIESSDLVGNGNSETAANIREIRHTYNRQTKLPKSLVEEINKTTSLAHQDWAKARKDSDFKRFTPWLEKILDLTRQKAEAYGYEGEPYNALLDDYEPGATVEEIGEVFKNLRDPLVDLVARIKDAPKEPDYSIVERDYDVDMQKVFGEMVATKMGFDFTAGRLDVTVHPFCSGFGPGDTRITTRYNPKRLNDALFGTMHEAGHGLYEMGLPKEKHFGMPIADSASLGIHESQSRMWENQVGRSKEFWVYFLPLAKGMFREALEDVSLDDFYGAINYVTPSYIRVEADEATYNLHILLRFELERLMIKGDLKPSDVPAEWNKRFKDYFGLDVDTDANGCLQDVHWSAGLIGYFPTYTLGNLYSAQFFAKANKDIPDLPRQFEQGEFGSLLKWLRENIHQHGIRWRAPELCKRVTGEPLSHKPLLDYMNAKYGEIYGI
jgi:carboxypeptidase Taq